MKNRIAIISMLICLLSGANVSAQVKVREASANVTNIYSALKYIVDNSVAPDANGVIHIDITDDVCEPSSFETEDNNLFPISSNIKKVLISSSSSTKHNVTTNVTYSGIYGKFTVYMLHFEDKSGELEVENLSFTNYFAWMASTSSIASNAKSRTYFHGCIFNNGYQIKSNVTEGHPEYQSDVFEFDNNVYPYGTDYIYQNSNVYKTGETFIFKNNELYNFRGAALIPTKTTPINVIFLNNIYYRQRTFPDFGGTSVTLCQVTGAINGNWTFQRNRVLGLFKAFDVDADQKSCALLQNQGANGYLGIVDGSNITITDNIIQCDVFEVGTKGGTGAGYETGDCTEKVLNKEYYNIMGDDDQTGNYTAIIYNNQKVHMYPKASGTHDDDDACHICEACGQVVIRAKVSGHGGTFQYEGADHQMHDVNSAVATITKNLYPDDIAPGVDLYAKVVSNITRDGFCLDPKKSQEFVITPTLPGAFKALKFYGYAAPVDVTSQASTSDGGKTYRYTLTNNYTHSNPYIVCPVLIASITFGSITVKCNGLEKNDCALFLVEGEDGTKFWVNLSGVHPSKTISGLKPGSYTVKPHNTSSQNWQWTYTMTPSSSTVKTVNADELVTVTYSVTKKSGVTVKHGENYKDNELEAGAATDSINSWKKKGSYDL